MSKLLAALVASTFALGSAAGFAADAAKKKEELTKEERAEMRSRAERLIAQRAAQPTAPEQARAADKAPKAKKHHGTKQRKDAKQGQPKA
jgi:hypothetical protein